MIKDVSSINTIPELCIGDILSNNDVIRIFKVGNMGGMKYSAKQILL